MMTLICGTNRPGSYSGEVARFYRTRLDRAGVEYRYFTLQDIPQDLINNAMYGNDTHPGLAKIQDEILKPASKIILVFPEYNGSFPGVLKAFIDASDIVNCWHHKKICFVGVAAGRAGNLRGMEHMTNIMNHIKVDVLHHKIPISRVESVMNAEEEITDGEIIKLIDRQIELFREF